MLNSIRKFFRHEPELTLEVALGLYLECVDISKRRNQKLKYAIRKWVRAGGSSDLRKITTAEFVAVRATILKMGHAPITIEETISIVHCLMRHCGPGTRSTPQGRGLLKWIPTVGRRLHIDLLPKPAVALADLDAVYRFAAIAKYKPRRWRHSAPMFWRCLFAICYVTGMRFGDLSALTWDSVKWDEDAIVFRARKTRKMQAVPIGSVLRNHLMVIREDSGSVLKMAKLGCYMRKGLREICEAAGVGYFSAQSIRRRSGTEYERARPGAGGLLLGHAIVDGRGSSQPGSATTFSHYISALDIVLKPAQEQLEYPPSFSFGPNLEASPSLANR